MRRLREVTLATMMVIAQTSAQAADLAYVPSHPRVARAYARPVPPPPYPAPVPPRVGWALMPGIAYAPIAPQDYSLAAREYYSRLWEPYPFCCPDPYYVPVIIP